MNFANAVVCGATETTNGMPALKNSGNGLVNFFFGVGAARNNPNKAISDFIDAFDEDKLLATKILFWARDVRGGAGERQIFRTLLNTLEQSNADVVIKNIHLIPVVGRWDDLLCFTTPTVIRAAYQLISDTLLNQGLNYKQILDNIDTMSEDECKTELKKLGIIHIYDDQS